MKVTDNGDKIAEVKETESACLRLDPEKRLCPKFDSVSVAKFRVAERGKMGLRVVDDCAEEHRM